MKNLHAVRLVTVKKTTRITDFLFFIFCLLFFFSNNWNQLVAQSDTPILFHNINKKDGLPSNFVSGIAKDSLGFLWVATKDGLCRFDGPNQVEVIRPKEENSLETGDIRSIHIDREQNIWLGTRLGGLTRFNPIKGTWKTFKHDLTNPSSISNDEILSILEDKQHRLWVGTENGLNLFNYKTEQFTSFLMDKNNPLGLKSKSILSILEDDKGWIWVGTWGGGLYLLLEEEGKPFDGKFRYFPLSSNEVMHNVWAMHQNPEKNYWIGTFGDGLYRMDIDDNASNRPNAQSWQPQLYHYQKNEKDLTSISHNLIQAIHQDKEGKLWIATVDGLSVTDFPEYAANPTTLKFTNYRFNPKDPTSLVGNNSTVIFEDEQGLVWIGTSTGISQYNKYINQFKFHEILDYTYTMPNTQHIYVDANQTAWLAVGEKGLIKYDINQGKKEYLLQQYPTLLLDNFVSVVYSRDDVWLYFGTKKGISAVNRYTMETKHFPIPPDLKEQIGEVIVQNIFIDKAEKIWVGTEIGLFSIHQKTKEYIHFFHQPENPNSISDNSITDVISDKNGHLWVATYRGLNQLQFSANGAPQFKHFLHDTNQPKKSLISNRVISLAEVGDQLFIGTSNGLCSYDYLTNQIETFNVEGTNFWIQTLAATADNKLWGSTFDGLFYFDIPTKKYNIFEKEDGLKETYFLTGALTKDQKDCLYMGSLTGFTMIDVNNILSNEQPPLVYITEAQITNPKRQINQNTIYQDTLYLNPSDYYLSLGFSALNFNSPQKNKYAYRLKGLDEKWRYTSINNPAVYTNLNPRTYEFQVKAANNDGVWNEEGNKLIIIKHPAVWQTWWFKLSLLMLGLCLTFIGFRFYTNRLEEKRILEANRLEEKRILEANRLEEKRILEANIQKNRLLTNIAHELQTPLNLIQGISSHLKELAYFKQANNRQYPEIIIRNANYLSNIVNDMLALNKDKIAQSKMKPSLFILPELINFILPEYTFLAEQKKIDLKLSSFPSTTAPIVHLDIDKLTTIFNNILSNAIKYTQVGGTVSIEYLEGVTHILKIKDNGYGIAANEIPNIFNRYFQSKQAQDQGGFGIGLAICKEYALALNGTLEVESQLGEGSVFTISFPKQKVAVLNQLAKEKPLYQFPKINTFDSIELNQETKEVDVDSPLPHLLIVEDNLDYCKYLELTLQEAYELSFVHDGNQALLFLENQIPDLIISDWMMPNMDGYELLNQLKHKVKYQNIPMIFLTARSLISDKLKALRGGATDYLIKPVDQEKLLSTINKSLALIKNENSLNAQLKFSKIIDKDIVLDKAHQDWLIKLEAVTLSNITNYSLGSKEIAELMGIGLTGLNEKVKANTGLTTKKFIQELKFWEARRLLEEGEVDSVKTLGLSIGVKDVKNFSRNFKKRFGRYPSEFLAN